jgi:hypothetical protein
VAPKGRRWRLLQIKPDGTRFYFGLTFRSYAKALEARKTLPPDVEIHVVREVSRPSRAR